MNIDKNIQHELIRLKSIFNHSNDGIITIDRLGLIESVNPAAAHIFGYQPDEVIGQNIKILMPEPYQSEHDNYINRYQQTGTPHIIGIGREVEGKRKDGSTFPFYLSVSEVKLEGKVIYTGFIHDISNLKRKEAELRDSQNQLLSLFETAVDGIVIINDRGIMQMVNPAVSRLFGYDHESLVGQNVKLLMAGKVQQEHDSYIQNYLNTKKAIIIGIGREVEGTRKDGSTFPIKLSVSEIKQDGKPMFTGIIHDLTEQKKAQKAILQLNEQLEIKVEERMEELSKTVSKLLESNKKLEHEIQERHRIEEALRQSEQEIRNSLEKEKELSELKSRFVSMASHEFRTPLSTILSSAVLFGRYKEADQQPQRNKHIERIKSSVNNLTNILNDFLSLSKLEEGKIQKRSEYFVLQDLYLEVIDEMQGLVKEKQKIVLRNDLPEHFQLYVDRNILKNILFNLISNAIKYSPADSTIYCRQKINESGLLELSVIDEGMGIPLEDQPHMFSRFFRASNAANIKGTGLGLHIVKGYLDMLEGHIDFKSEEGKGTTFNVTLPIQKDQ